MEKGSIIDAQLELKEQQEKMFVWPASYSEVGLLDWKDALGQYSANWPLKNRLLDMKKMGLQIPPKVKPFKEIYVKP